MVPYTSIRTRFWKRVALLGIVMAVVLPDLAMACFMPFTVVGVAPLMVQVDIGAQQQGHPEGKVVMNVFFSPTSSHRVHRGDLYRSLMSLLVPRLSAFRRVNTAAQPESTLLKSGQFVFNRGSER